MNENIEIRKVQFYGGGRSVQIVLPRIFAESLKLCRGDYLKLILDQERLIIEKANV